MPPALSTTPCAWSDESGPPPHQDEDGPFTIDKMEDVGGTELTAALAGPDFRAVASTLPSVSPNLQVQMDALDPSLTQCLHRL